MRVFVTGASGHLGAAVHRGSQSDLGTVRRGASNAARTRERLGWKPAHAGLIADLEAGHYFRVG